MSVPVELIRIAIGTTVYGYTPGDRDVEYEDVAYVMESIQRTEIEQGAEINRANITITLPITNEVAALYLANAPDFPATVSIIRFDDDPRMIWKGRIVGASCTGAEVDLEVESTFTTLRQRGPRRMSSKRCPYAHYQGGCTLDAEDFVIHATATAASWPVITVPQASGYADGWFTGGMVRGPDGVVRWITSHIGDQLTVHRPLESIAQAILTGAGWDLGWDKYWDGYNIKLYPGCDRTLDICATKFGNSINYGGQKWIPDRNPMAGSSIMW